MSIARVTALNAEQQGLQKAQLGKLEDQLSKLNTQIELLEADGLKKHLGPLYEDQLLLKAKIKKVQEFFSPEYFAKYNKETDNHQLRLAKKIETLAKQYKSTQELIYGTTGAIQKSNAFFSKVVEQSLADIVNASSLEDLRRLQFPLDRLYAEQRAVFQSINQKYPTPDFRTNETASMTETFNSAEYPAISVKVSLSDTDKLTFEQRARYQAYIMKGDMYSVDPTVEFHKGLSHLSHGEKSFVIIKNKGLFVFDHLDSIDRMTHASFILDGDEVLAAGSLKVSDKRKLEVLTNYSGHLKPTSLEHLSAVEYFQHYNVDLTHVTVKLRNPEQGLQSAPESEEEKKLRASVDPSLHHSSDPNVVNKIMTSYKATDFMSHMKKMKTENRTSPNAALANQIDSLIEGLERPPAGSEKEKTRVALLEKGEALKTGTLSATKDQIKELRGQFEALQTEVKQFNSEIVEQRPKKTIYGAGS